MSKLPGVRPGSLPKEDSDFHEFQVDFQPTSDSKFAFTWPDNPMQQTASRLDHPPTHATPEETDSTPTNSQDEASVHPNLHTRQASSSSSASPVPRLSRAFSMPLPSQITHFQHFARTPSSGSPPTPISASEVHQLQDFSLELADSLQVAIQTLLQLSPPQLFDPAKEQFSSCAVQIPTTSISALLTSMKNLNYMSANMHRFGSPKRDGTSSPSESNDAVSKDDFDIGELLQSVGDSLGGVAADAEVDLVLHHGDAGIKHIGVKGDECGISYALTHIIHQVLITTRKGDSIEVGLSIIGQPSAMVPDAADSSGSSSFSRRASMSDSPILDDEGPVVCTFDIAHRFFSSSADTPSHERPDGEPPPNQKVQSHNGELRPEPQFDSAILRRLLRHVGGTLRPSLQPRLFTTGRRSEFSVTLERGLPLSVLHQRTPPVEEEMARRYPNVRLAREPTLEELTSFAETLRGKKVAFHASSQGSFAHHLTRYLTAWGMDISHVPTDDAEEKDPVEDASILLAESVFSPTSSTVALTSEVVPPIIDASSASDSPEENKAPAVAGLSFVIIDDDVVALRRRLLQHRAESVPSLHLHPRKQRPSLAANHRPRSSPSIRSSVQSPAHQLFSAVPIVHFTSLVNYKIVKDAIQNALLPESSPILPEVIVILKPAGPRRLLTALHTAVNKPVIDPFFSPIATSPMSPSGSLTPFMSGHRRPMNSTTPPTAPARSVRSGGGTSSPLPIPEGLEYFSDTSSVKKLGGNAASGLVIQSPDGRPAGIFFQPQSRTSSSSSRTEMLMERERGATVSLSRSRRGSAQKGSNADAMETPNNASQTAAPSIKPSLILPTDKPAPASSVHVERPQTEFTRSFKGKGRVPMPSSEQAGKSHSMSLSSTAWREATQKLARQNLTPPVASNNDTTQLSPASNVSQPATHSSSSPPSSENRKSVARRATQGGPKSPVVSKKPKGMGNNIVPPISVLIVEDNAINQTILSTFMRRNKIKYEVAWNGREAVEKWRHGNFHLILMDIQMPVMDGIEATKEIRRLEKIENNAFPPSPGARSAYSGSTPDSRPSSASSTPFRSQVIIVALTASSLQSDRVAALAAGCNDFLTKPVTNSWLNDKIIEWGSIKALQMWAELRPEVAKDLSPDQEAQAQAVANKLHVPSSVTRKSPLSGGHVPLSAIGEASRDTIVSPADDVLPPRRHASHPTDDKGSSGSDSSPEPWPISSDDEGPQDPITEPPAVIETPERSPISLPETDASPHAVTGEAALLSFLEESKDERAVRPTMLGQRAKSSFSTSTSIASVMHDTPGVGGTSIGGLAAVGDAFRETRTPSEPLGEEKDDPGGH